MNIRNNTYSPPTTVNIVYSRAIHGGYSFKTGEIYLHPNLKKFPSLYRAVLDHELKHAAYHYSVFKHIALDLKDNWRIVARDDCQEYLDTIENITLKEVAVQAAYFVLSTIIFPVWGVRAVCLRIRYKLSKRGDG